ncbi:ATP-binding cassette domain-containing protein [Shinella sp. NM-101]|uniref:ATP-binding cassette domain-containing protein n=1 Tax=Shinella sp. NM-101 TaxID=2744455 RepID=UPI001F3FC0D0|nr:ATP-binding cassette domain-containing protein [Shinella sp. NM-101]
MEDAAVVIRGLSHSYPEQGASELALSAVDLTVRKGLITGLAGPDGAGKTTLMRIMAGLLKATAGTIRVVGLDPIGKADALHMRVGYMPQKFGLYEDLTVMENLVLYANLRGVGREERKVQFKRLLDFTDLHRFTERPAGKLSGGMKQKLGLACTLIGRPELLLLDEPGVGVDPISRRDLWRMVQSLAEGGMAVVWATAYLDEAERCDELFLMNDGNVIFSGKPSEQIDRMRGRSILVRNIDGNRRHFLRRALGSEGVTDGVIQGESVRLVLKEGIERPAPNLLLDEPDASTVPAEPRLEDAFVDLVGGAPDGRSVLAETMPDVELPAGLDATAVIRCRELTRKFGDFTATDHVTFDVRKGEIFGLLGPNGAGKSTTFRMLCGLLTPTSGEAQVMGIDLKKSASDARQKLGYMAQKFSLYSNLGVEQNLTFFSGIYGLKGRTRERKIAQMLESFDLGRYRRTPAGELPLGFKQRLALACALMHEPPLMFLDEPTSGVDPVTRREFWTHINALVDKGVTVMVTTHFMDEAEYCDRIALIYRGRMIAAGPPDELKRRVASDDLPDPTFEDAFIQLIQRDDEARERMQGNAA